jgi:hypothetical protein
MSPLTLTTKFFAPFSTGQGPGPKGPPLHEDLIISNTTLKAGKVIGQNGGIGPNGEFNFNLPNRAGGRAYFHGVGRCPNPFPAGAPRPSGGTVVHSGPGPATVNAINKCINSFHLTSVLKYQPLDRYWTFQWYELGSYVVLSALLCAFSLWWVRRR